MTRVKTNDKVLGFRSRNSHVLGILDVTQLIELWYLKVLAVASHFKCAPFLCGDNFLFKQFETTQQRATEWDTEISLSAILNVTYLIMLPN